MEIPRLHNFHIPVMGIAFTIDTPAKVAHFGISSVVSIIEDQLAERMRSILCRKYSLPYIGIGDKHHDARAARITAYLNVLQDVVNLNMKNLQCQQFGTGSDIDRYFEMLPEDSELKSDYRKLSKLNGTQHDQAVTHLKQMLRPGAIDVNIMTKLDKTNYTSEGEALPAEYSDALAALRGFANSKLCSSIIFSAGLNPRLYSYCESFPDFFPDASGNIKKKIILKVSDFRSALIQGKFLAKKGLWISEFRIESGLNCGGHAFATDGLLLGPILEEFRDKRDSLREELFGICSGALKQKDRKFTGKPEFAITVQGGVGTSSENEFLMDHYGLNSIGWGSPFLLVPEATTVDESTLNKLASAKQDDYYLSHSSPLGVPFNNFRSSSSEEQRKMRIAKNRPGSPCYKKFLSSNTEFTEKPICTASREYQDRKIKQARVTHVNEDDYQIAVESIMEKDCLCEGLGASALLANNEKPFHKLSAVAICPGPNLAYFSGVHKLCEMVDHIYGRTNILNQLPRPHVFVNELALYLNYFKEEVQKNLDTITAKQAAYYKSFKENLLKGINYYFGIAPMIHPVDALRDEMLEQLFEMKLKLESIWNNELQIKPAALQK